MTEYVSQADRERFPLLTARGLRLLRRMREHPHAPCFNFPCGDRLNAGGLAAVRAFDRMIREADERPGTWATEESAQVQAAAWYAQVPFYRRRGAFPATWQNIPTMSREDLRRDLWALVPDPQPLDDLIVYYTSGTTGTQLHIPSHPVTASQFLPALQLALRRAGIAFDPGPETVAIMQVCSQQNVLTHAAVSAYLNEAGYVKINLVPTDWRSPDDITAYIDDLQPQILTGDPITFLALAAHSFSWRPKALVSSAMTLLPATRAFLEQRFGVPVLDVYSMSECRFIAASAHDGDLDIILPDLLVEILDRDGCSCPPGTVGEITLTSGRNPFQPLLRYRTGDFAELTITADRRSLRRFSGRQPVLFQSPDGRWFNNIDLLRLLKPFPISRFSLHQHRDLSLRLRVDGLPQSVCRSLAEGKEAGADCRAIRDGFEQLFGPGLTLEIRPFEESGLAEKHREFSSDLDVPSGELHLSYGPPKGAADNPPQQPLEEQP